jgi:hypothetical protein
MRLALGRPRVTKKIIRKLQPCLVDGLVVSDPYGGKYEDRMAVYAAERFKSMARNPAVGLQ